MINSMTGYGQAQGEVNGVSYVVEIKTLNNRYLKVIVKLPEAMAFLEEDVGKLLRGSLSRGTVNYVLRLKDTSAKTLFEINEAALQVIVEKLSRAGSSSCANGTIDIGNLLNLPGIIQPASPDQELADEIKQVVLEISRQAIDKVRQMRAAEGKCLEEDLNEQCEAIEENLKQIQTRGNVVLHQYAKRLKQRVDELLAEAKLKLDEETLAKEVAIFADRSDISEEIARLDSHLKQFIQCCT